MPSIVLVTIVEIISFSRHLGPTRLRVYFVQFLLNGIKLAKRRKAQQNALHHATRTLHAPRGVRRSSPSSPAKVVANVQKAQEQKAQAEPAPVQEKRSPKLLAADRLNFEPKARAVSAPNHFSSLVQGRQQQPRNEASDSANSIASLFSSSNRFWVALVLVY